jgi:uncharacterized membrane protein
MQLTPAITIHLAAALGALAIGPVALWARKGATQRPRLHRAAGYAWVTLMVVTAVSAMFVRDTGSGLPTFLGYSPIHILVPITLVGLVQAFRALAQGNIAAHRATMQRLYFGASVTAGFFALAPGRFLGNLINSSMLLQIVAHTPTWVWGLLVGLLVLGYTQTRDRQASLVRLLATPAIMGGYSLWGSATTFGGSPHFAVVMTTWAVVAVAVFRAMATGTAKATYDSATRTFQLPGSWVPMGLIAGIFLVKYASGVAITMHRELLGDLVFGVALAAVSGVFSGIFAGRAARVVKLAVRPVQPAAALQA